MDYYPENRTSSFTVQIPRYIRLFGEWEVGLAEIQYPYTFYTVSHGHNEMQLVFYDATEDFAKLVTENPNTLLPFRSVQTTIPVGFYQKRNELVKTMDSVIQKHRCNGNIGLWYWKQ